MPQFQTAVLREELMKTAKRISGTMHYRTILPAILRITFSLFWGSLGFASMNLVDAQTKPQRMVRDYRLDRAKLEQLQRWVNAGHDTWCRDPKLVASAAWQQVAPDLAGSEFGLASLPTERITAHGTKSVYTFSTLDGRTTYQVTLRRFHWLLSAAGTTDKMIWAPVRIETIIRPATD
jgi:hypothetical protein